MATADLAEPPNAEPPRDCPLCPRLVDYRRENQAAHPDSLSGRREDLGTLRGRIAASIACHAAIKVNTPLEPLKMAWLLQELAKTLHPTSCPHGRPIALRYSWIEIQRAFQRI